MKNKYFPDEEIDRDDLYFICYMIERVARRTHQRNEYVINKIGKEELYHLISCAKALHCENPKQTEEDWIKEYDIDNGDFDISDVNRKLVDTIPSATQMGRVYCRLILNTLQPEENYVDGIVRVYNNELCKVIDNYNGSAYYEPSYVITRAYYNNGF